MAAVQCAKEAKSVQKKKSPIAVFESAIGGSLYLIII
jgi:hypothetical protein